MDLSRTNVPLILFLALLLLVSSGAGLGLILTDPHAVEGRHEPAVQEIRPTPGGIVNRATTVEFLFTQRMDRASVEQALILSPHFPYGVEWTREGQRDRLIIRPHHNLEWDTNYRVQISTEARNRAGRRLRQPAEVTFVTGDIVQVAEVKPVDGAENVEVNQPITIRFDRPIVRSSDGIEHERQIRPVMLNPPTPGTGEWIEPDLYAFYPMEQWEESTNYVATVNLLVAPGRELDAPYEWHFRTEKRALTNSFPTNAARAPGWKR